MKADLRKIRMKRKFTEEFKKQIVGEFEKGGHSVQELCRLYDLHSSSLYSWIYKYSRFNEKGYRIIEMKESSTQKIKELEERIKELESSLGRK